MTDKPVTLAVIIGAHGVTGEVRLKLFGEGPRRTIDVVGDEEMVAGLEAGEKRHGDRCKTRRHADGASRAGDPAHGERVARGGGRVVGE